jgi:hypothetical protein
MNQPDLADAAATPYVFGALGDYYSQASMSQSIQGNFTSAIEHLSASGSNLPIFDAVNDTAFTLAPTSMGTFTNLNYAYTVSNQSFDCEHWLTLPRHRTPPILGLSGPAHVRLIPTSVTILRAHRIQIQLRSPRSYSTTIGEGFIPIHYRT